MLVGILNHPRFLSNGTTSTAEHEEEVNAARGACPITEMELCSKFLTIVKNEDTRKETINNRPVAGQAIQQCTEHEGCKSRWKANDVCKLHRVRPAEGGAQACTEGDPWCAEASEVTAGKRLHRIVLGTRE